MPTDRRSPHRHWPSTDAQVLCVGAESLPFPDGAFDVVVSTLVLCTVPDPAAAVTEARRVLRPGGRLLYLERVRAQDARLVRRQDRLAAPWRAFASGCRCNQSTLDLLRASFELEPPTRATWRGMPSIVHPLVSGTAVVPLWSGGAPSRTADADRRVDELTGSVHEHVDPAARPDGPARRSQHPRAAGDRHVECRHQTDEARESLPWSTAPGYCPSWRPGVRCS